MNKALLVSLAVLAHPSQPTLLIPSLLPASHSRQTQLAHRAPSAVDAIASRPVPYVGPVSPNDIRYETSAEASVRSAE